MSEQTILIPAGGTYPADAIIQSVDGSCYPMGGGFVFRLKAGHSYRPVTQEEMNARHYRPALFSIDGGTVYAGFTTGRRWNGWECPVFTREVAERIFQDACLKYDYLPEIDSFRMLDEWADEDDPYAYAEGFDYAGVRLYSIMDGWTWDEETPVQEDEDNE
jgi:hypothetical protein